MGYGLGKFTPIVFYQSKANFEALINRRGQWVRWRVAKKCPCVTESSQPDIHCPKCGGNGDIYDYQRKYEDIFRATARNNVVSIPEEYLDAEILEVYDSKVRQYPFTRYGDFIQIEGGKIPNNEHIDIRVSVPVVKHLEKTSLEKVGGGYYRVPGILTTPSAVDNVYYQAAGDVIAIAELKDPEGNPVNILGYRRDMVFTDSNAETITAESVDYIMPFRLVVLSQELSEEDLALVNAQNGDAVCTYPFMYNLSENDVLTVLSGTMTHKILVEKRGNGIDDTIPEFFLHKIDSLETKNDVFEEGKDFLLIGTNNLHWITAKQPETGEVMSITYRYNPTYKVAKEIPNLRTSEDQHMPRKVVLKLFAAYGEAKGVNRNG
jgi:hypothetical protein